MDKVVQAKFPSGQLWMYVDQLPHWKGMLARKGYDADKYALIEQALGRCKLAFDLGANAGMIMLHLTKFVDKVVAVEPNQRTFDLLQYNVVANKLAGRVFCEHCAVTDFDGIVRLDTDMVSDGVCRLSDCRGGIAGTELVRALTLDDLSRKYGYPDLIKVDTEGCGWRVVHGGPRTMLRIRGVLIELNECRDPFTRVDTNPIAWRMIRASGLKRLKLSLRRGNFFFVRRLRQAKQRLKI